MALCPSCNKFAALDSSSEPEINVGVESELLVTDPDEPSDVDKATARVNGDCRIVLTSECCGEEMKETTFEISDVDIDIARAEGCNCDLTALEVEASGEIVDRQETSEPKTYKIGPKKGQTVDVPIPPRFQKRFYGAELEITVSCACGKTMGTEQWKDECQASSMDDL
jgi:hypothetical protein